MEDDKEVTVEVTPEDMEFRARAKAAGLPDVLISMYGTALKRLVADEREACAKVCDKKAKETFSGQCAVWGDYFARAIRARAQQPDPQIADRLARHGIPMPGDPK